MSTAIRNISQSILSEILQIHDEPGQKDFRIACSDGPIYVAKFLVEIISQKCLLLPDIVQDESGLIIPEVSKNTVKNFFDNLLSTESSHSSTVSDDILSGLSWINWKEWQIKGAASRPILKPTQPSIGVTLQPTKQFCHPPKSVLPKDSKFAPTKFPKKKSGLTPLKSTKSTCTICGKALCDKFSLKKHVDTVHLNIRPFECLVCQKRFILKSDLETHASNVHDKKKTCVCEICGVSLSTRHSLRSHMLTHDSTTKLIQCARCPMTFRHASTYRKHIVRIHEFTQNKRLKCQTCGKLYNHEEGLRRHTKKCHSDSTDDFKCVLCTKAYAFQYELNRHLRSFHKQQQKLLLPATAAVEGGNNFGGGTAVDARSTENSLVH